MLPAQKLRPVRAVTCSAVHLPLTIVLRLSIPAPAPPTSAPTAAATTLSGHQTAILTTHCALWARGAPGKSDQRLLDWRLMTASESTAAPKTARPRVTSCAS